MKKFFMLLSISLLMMGFGVTTLASENDDLDKVLEKVEKTNEVIDNMITEALDDADDLLEKYNEKSEELLIGKEVLKAEQEIQKVTDKINALDPADDKYEKDLEKLLDKLVDKEEILIKEVDKAKEKYEKDYEKTQEKLAKIALKYECDMDEIVQDLIDDTNDKAGKMKENAFEKNIIVICEWVEVIIDGETYWIDPLKVVSF